MTMISAPFDVTPELEHVIRQANFWLEELDRRLRVEEAASASAISTTGVSITTKSPSQVRAGDASVKGVDTGAARGDHGHGVETALAANIQKTGTANSAGTSPTIPRGDHVHELDDHDHVVSGSGRGGIIGPLNEIKLQVLTSAPGSPANGWMVYADGTSWNPGSGEGFYGYEAGVWMKL